LDEGAGNERATERQQQQQQQRQGTPGVCRGEGLWQRQQPATGQIIILAFSGGQMQWTIDDDGGEAG